MSKRVVDVQGRQKVGLGEVQLAWRVPVERTAIVMRECRSVVIRKMFPTRASVVDRKRCSHACHVAPEL